MNIFATSPCPIHSAVSLDDKRIVKMCLETTQILCSAMGGEYKPTHIGHPCVKWAARSRSNAFWLAVHGVTLFSLYRYGFNRTHKSEPVLEAFIERHGLEIEYNDNMQSPEGFQNSARNPRFRLDFTNEEDTFLAYRKYLAHRWAYDFRRPTWRCGLEPLWRRKIEITP